MLSFASESANLCQRVHLDDYCSHVGLCVIIRVGRPHFDLNQREAVPIWASGFAAIKSAAQDLPLRAASKSIVSLDMEDAMERWEGDAG